MLNEDFSGRITTAVRVRPLSKKEKETDGNRLAVDCSNPGKVTCLKTESFSLSFFTDHVFDDTYSTNLNQSQIKVYRTLAVPLLQKALLGYNACLFAYGVTSSGKTHSMYGTPSNLGIVPRIINDLFDYIRLRKEPNSSFSVKFSYFEIYNEKIYDLLQDKNPAPKLRVREDPLEGPYIPDLVQPVVHSPAEVFDWLRKGNSRRKVAATEVNANSSRSHTIASFYFTKRELASFSKKASVENVITSKLNFVDLAGSERQSMTNNVDERLAEACQINKSLFTLGRVIYQLSVESSVCSATNSTTPLSSKRKASHVSYRDSLLTWILKDSLGGNSVTTMLATVSPSSLRTEDTISTLQHVTQAQRIFNQAIVNEDPSGVIIRELKAQVENLRKCHREASKTNSPLHGQIKNLEILLKTRETEVAELTRELTERTLDCERLRAEVTLRSSSMETIPQLLFPEDMDPNCFNGTPIRWPRSCDERDSGTYSDVSRHLPDGSEQRDSSVQTESNDIANDVALVDAHSKTILDEESTIVNPEFRDASMNTDDLFKMVPLEEYEKLLSESKVLETVDKVNQSVQAREDDFGLCLLPFDQLEALNVMDKNQSRSADVTNEEINEIASSSFNEDHVIPLKEFSQLMDDLYHTQQRIHELEAEKHTRLYNLTDVSTNTSIDVEVISSSSLNKLEEKIKELESALTTFANVPKRDVSTCSSALDCKVLSRSEYKLMQDELMAMRSRRYADAATSTTLQGDISPFSEVVAPKKEIANLQEELSCFKNVHQKCSKTTDCGDLDYVFTDTSTMEEIAQVVFRLEAIEAKSYAESATLTGTEVEVIPRSELKALWNDLRSVESQSETYRKIEKREVSTCSTDLDCKIMDSAAFSQMVNEINSMRNRLLSIDAKKYADSMTLTDHSSEIISYTMPMDTRNQEPIPSVQKCEAATSTSDFGYEVLSKTFKSTGAMTEEPVVVLPQADLTAMKERMHHLESHLGIIGNILKLEPFGGQNSEFLLVAIVENVGQMQARLAEFENRVLVDTCTEINDYELGVTVLSTNYFHELLERQYRIKEKLTHIKPKADLSVSTELGLIDCDFETLLGRIDELKAVMERYQATVDDVESSLVVEEEPKQEQIAESGEQDLAGTDITSDTTTNRFLGNVPKRMDTYVLNKVKYFENLQSFGDATGPSATLKRCRLEEISDNKENEHPGKRPKSTQTELEGMNSTEIEDEMKLMKYKINNQSWLLQHLEKENKQLLELLTKLIRAHRATPSSYVISILDDVKKTLNQVSDDMNRDERTV